MKQTDKKVMTFEEGCKYLGYSKSYMHKLISARIIPFSKPRKKIYFEREKLENWMLGNSSPGFAENQIKAYTYIKIKK